MIDNILVAIVLCIAIISFAACYIANRYCSCKERLNAPLKAKSQDNATNAAKFPMFTSYEKTTTYK